MSQNKVELAQLETLTIINSAVSLGAAGVLVGPTIYVGGYTHISGFAFSDVASAANGLVIEQAYAAADFPIGVPSTSLITRSLYGIAAGDMDNNAFAVQVVAPFARITYTNGAAPQTSFRIYFAARILRGL